MSQLEAEDRMRVLQGHGVGAVQDDPAADTDAEFVDARRTRGQDEVRQVLQTAGAIPPAKQNDAPGFARSF